MSLPSDITPGIAPLIVDRALVLAEIDRLQAKLDELKPFVVRIGGLFCLYHGKEVTVQLQTAQQMIEYLSAHLPAGLIIRWFVLPAQPPMQAA